MPKYANEFATEICKALGLDPSRVSNVVIEILMGDVVRVTVEQVALSNDAERIKEILKRYEFDVRRVDRCD